MALMKLLRLAESSFDVFVTADQNLRYQQNLAGFNLGVLVLVARRTRVTDLEPLIPAVLAELEYLSAGEVKRIVL